VLQAGPLHVTEATGQAWAPAQESRSRNVVQAEAVAAVASGEIRVRASEAGSVDGQFGTARTPTLIAGR
jgi:hypothetical protein